jgi:hypothetical protein
MLVVVFIGYDRVPDMVPIPAGAYYGGVWFFFRAAA